MYLPLVEFVGEIGAICSLANLGRSLGPSVSGPNLSKIGKDTQKVRPRYVVSEARPVAGASRHAVWPSNRPALLLMTFRRGSRPQRIGPQRRSGREIGTIFAY